MVAGHYVVYFLCINIRDLFDQVLGYLVYNFLRFPLVTQTPLEYNSLRFPVQCIAFSSLDTNAA